MCQPRQFWAGLDPDRPESLDKVLAALHCFQVAPPSACDAFYFEFTVNPEDHHRINNGFPELQRLAKATSKSLGNSCWGIPFVSGGDQSRITASIVSNSTILLKEFDPSTGKLATMDRDQFQMALLSIMVDFHHLVAKDLEPFRQLEEPIGPLALGVERRALISDNCTWFMHFHSTRKNKNPSCVFVFYHGNHEGPSKFAQLITKHPQDTRTVVAVKVALPGKMDSTRKMQRLAQ